MRHPLVRGLHIILTMIPRVFESLCFVSLLRVGIPAILFDEGSR
jgi:hypothetical protein